MQQGRSTRRTAASMRGDPVIALSLDDDFLDALAALIERRLSASRTERNGSPWMTAAEAAEYLRCPVSRVRKLTMTRELPCHRDGRRVLYSADELDEFIRRGGARSP